MSSSLSLAVTGLSMRAPADVFSSIERSVASSSKNSGARFRVLPPLLPDVDGGGGGGDGGGATVTVTLTAGAMVTPR